MRFSMSACGPRQYENPGPRAWRPETFHRVGGVASATYLLGGVLDQMLRVPFAPGSRLRADVDEVPGVGVVPAEDVVLGVVQQGEELVEEAFLALLGEFPVEAEHAAPEHGAEIVHVLVRGHPVSRGAC